MQEWLKISLQLCVYGFFLGMTPLSHYDFKFLTEFRGIPGEDVTSFFFAQITYWNLGLLIFVFLLTDMLRYKPLIILSALSGMSYYATMRWTHGLNPLTAAAFFFALGSATDIAYLTYIYAKVEKKHYQQVTSNTRGAFLLGRGIGSVIAQLFMMYDVVSVDKLAYISFGSKCMALLVAISLPAPKTSIYFYQAKKHATQPLPELEEKRSVDGFEKEQLVKFSWKDAKSLLWNHFKSGYSNQTVVLWSLAWSLLQTGFRMVYTYNQALWAFIEPDRGDIYNGFASTGMSLLGTIGAFLAAKLNQTFIEKWALWIVVTCCLGEGTLALVAGQTSNVIVSYVMYIILGSVYYFMLTVCSAIVAKNLKADSFGLIFGINTWFSLFFAFIFTLIVVSGKIFTLNPVEQYTIFGCYYFVIGIMFACYGVIRAIRHRLKVQ